MKVVHNIAIGGVILAVIAYLFMMYYLFAMLFGLGKGLFSLIPSSFFEINTTASTASTFELVAPRVPTSHDDPNTIEQRALRFETL